MGVIYRVDSEYTVDTQWHGQSVEDGVDPAFWPKLPHNFVFPLSYFCVLTLFQLITTHARGLWQGTGADFSDFDRTFEIRRAWEFECRIRFGFQMMDGCSLISNDFLEDRSTFRGRYFRNFEAEHKNSFRTSSIPLHISAEISPLLYSRLNNGHVWNWHPCFICYMY